MNRPRISILLPLRDEEEYLPAALASLRAQSYSHWELVAVDDGSTDGSSRILSTAAQRDRRIRVFSRPALGLVAALNFGLEACRADLVARMDADDISHPRRLELQGAALMEHPDLTLVASRVKHFPRPGLKQGMLVYEDWQNALLSHDQIMRDLYVESPFAHPSVLFRKEEIIKIGGYRDLKWAEDYDLWLRLAENGARFARLPETLLYWRDRPLRLTRTAENCTLDAFRACKAHFLQRGPLRGHDEVWIWGAGQEGKLWRKALARVGLRVGGWVEVAPNKIGQRIHQEEVLAYDQLPPEHPPILVCVGTKGIRDQIREFCCQRGMVEGSDFLCVT